MSNSSGGRSGVRTALGTVAVAWSFVVSVVPPDPFSALFALAPTTVVALAVAAWLTRADGWRRLGASPVPNSALWFWGTWVTVLIVGSLLVGTVLSAERGAVAAGPLADTLFALVATVVAAWVAYFGGAATVRRAVPR